MVCVLPGDAFLLNQEARAVHGSVLGQVCVEFLFGVGEVRERVALGSGSVCGEVPEAVQGRRVHQDGADGDAIAA